MASDGEDALILVMGRSSRQTIIEATHRIEGGGEVLTTPENVSHVSSVLPGREATPATLYLLGNDASLAEVPRG